MKNYSLSSLERKKLKIRKKIKELNALRLTVYKTNKHIYAQVFTFDGSRVITSVSTLDKVFKDRVGNLIITKTEKARIIGTLLAEKAKMNNISQLAFDRSGFKFHGRIKALAESVLENGVKC
ncbi:MAG: 50S ribosomal protein L18 [Enterobacteriaceae bacterium]|nr:50S ribosomal protein L18 [Enterobacteriaceae bacterium]